MIKVVDHDQSGRSCGVRLQYGQEWYIRSQRLIQQANQKLMATQDKLNATETVLADLNEHIHRLRKLLQAEHE